MKYQIVSVKPQTAWIDDPERPGKKKPGSRIGTVYTILKFKLKGPVLIDIKVPGPEIITNEEIKERVEARNVAFGDFQDLEDDQYIGRDGQLHRTGSAASVTLVEAEEVIDL